MDKIETMRAFARVAERRSFARAAQDLALSRSRVTEAVKLLERQLGVRLLTRTTRHVAPTAEGEDYHRRCVEILAAIDAADAAVTSAEPKGPLRVDVHGKFAQHFLLPALPSFLERYPGIHLHIGEGDRLVDLVSEGIDCVIRVGEAKDSGLIGRRLGALDEGTFASPGYLERGGIPATPDDLDSHRMIGFVSSRTKTIIPFEFQTKTGLKIILLPAAVTVGAASTNAALAVFQVLALFRCLVIAWPMKLPPANWLRFLLSGRLHRHQFSYSIPPVATSRRERERLSNGQRRHCW